MCGIFGVAGEAVGDSVLDAVDGLLRHRGPDDRGVLQLGNVTLLHRRLAIIDLTDSGHQPMSSTDGTVWLTYNGEVYNYPELRSELESTYAFRSTSDTEVVLAAYLRWGDQFLSRLRGMFALGLWDDRRQRLLCATDRLSIKPLLYHHDRNRLAFASEVKPLAALGVPLRPNRRRMYDYLRHGVLDHTDETLFEGIRQLRPGTYLVMQDDSVEVRRYWDLEESDDASWNEPESLRALERLVAEAVDLHLRGDVEPALSLSSGLDSTLLRALIQRDGARPGLQCFTFCFGDTPYDECARVSPTLRDTDVRHHTTNIKSDGLLERLDDLIRIVEEPVGGLGIFGYWVNAERVAERGIKVLLDGQGADEGFAGYKYYYGAWLGELERRGDLTRLETELRDLNAAHGTAIGYPSAEFEALVVRPGQPTQMRAPDGTAMESDYLTRDFSDEVGYVPEQLRTPFADAVKSAMYRDLFYLKIPKLLRFQDRCSMAWSVETRVPFLDHVLLEHLFRVPNDVLLSGGVTKALLRRVAAAYMPPPAREPKLYVATPQREWVKSELRDGIMELTRSSSLAADCYVDADTIRRQFEAYCASPELGNSFFIWKFLNLELWYRSFITSSGGVFASA